MSFRPSVRHDLEADAVYVRLMEGKVERTVELDDLRMVDVDAEGRPLGVEFLEVSGGVDLRGVPSRETVADLLGSLPVPVVTG